MTRKENAREREREVYIYLGRAFIQRREEEAKNVVCKFVRYIHSQKNAQIVCGGVFFFFFLNHIVSVFFFNLFSFYRFILILSFLFFLLSSLSFDFLVSFQLYLN